ncbi:MAG: hypothetical protein U1F15_13445 [Burkholderiales bacterium]
MYSLVEVEMPQLPHTPPDGAQAGAREIVRRVHASEDAWARHANAANGMGAGETATTVAHAGEGPVTSRGLRNSPA